MGIIKKQNTNTLQQMKFFTILALFGGINAIRLHAHSHLPAHNLHNVAQVQLGTHHQVKNFIILKPRETSSLPMSKRLRLRHGLRRSLPLVTKRSPRKKLKKDSKNSSRSTSCHQSLQM